MAEKHEHTHDHSEHGSELSEMQLRVRALETVLTEKGYVDPAALDAIIEAYETKVGPHVGARVVAKAWSDPSFKQALLEDGTKAVLALGAINRVGDHLIAVENTPKLHNMIVCTLCSCYPWEVLGLPPVWYKSAPYRSRAVNDPRGVLADFGVTLPADTAIRVWDSTAETRFIVLPMRPATTEGWSEEKLASLVTRDSMIGTGFPKQPAEVACWTAFTKWAACTASAKSKQRKTNLSFTTSGKDASMRFIARSVTPESGASIKRVLPVSNCRPMFIWRVPITGSGNWAWKSSLSSPAWPGPTSLQPGACCGPASPSNAN